MGPLEFGGTHLASFHSTGLDSSGRPRALAKRRTDMALGTLHDLYVEELRDLYSAENQLLKALPKMAKAATTPELKAAFEEHFEVTRGQVNRLEKIFSDLDASPKGKKCKAMTGLVEEEGETVDDAGTEAVKD